MGELLTPTAENLVRAATVLRGGGLVAFPTETVYGLGGNALDPAAVARVFDAKGRPARNPLIVHVADAGRVPDVAADFPDAARRLAERFWPGPLTLVLPRRDDLPAAVTAGGPTVAVRVPAHPVALDLLRAAGVPVAAPSANRSGELSPTTAEHVRRSLGDRVDLILDAGPTGRGIESTVLDVTGPRPRLLRPGPIPPGVLEAILGPIERSRVRESGSGPALPSPGQLSRHYAPRTPVELAADDGAGRVAELLGRGLRVGWLTFGRASESGERLWHVDLAPEPALAEPR